MTDPSLWNQILIWPILNLLIALYKGFSVIGLPGAFGFAIIALTVLIRGALTPLTNAQLKSAKKIQNLKPRLDELSRRHKDDKVKLQQAQLELYKEAGVNPAAGCLPLLLQIPVFIALYNVFIQVLDGGASAEFIASINKVLYHSALTIETLDLNFFGVNLAIKPSAWQTAGVWLLLIPVITGVLQFIQTKLMSPPSPKTDDKGAKQADAMADMQKQMGFVMPVMIGFFAFSFPVGLSLYWNIFSLFGIMQQLKVNKGV